MTRAESISDRRWGGRQGLLSREQRTVLSDYLDPYLDIRAYQRFACGALQNYPIDQVVWRYQYVQEIVRPQLQIKALDCIRAYKIDGFHTLIISATNTFIIDPIASLHGVDGYLGCEFEIVEGKYTGELTGIPTYKEGKILALDAWLESQNANASTIHFYSDSINDQPLLERADRAFVLIQIRPWRTLRRIVDGQ